MEEPSLSMAAPCKEGALDPSPSKVSKDVGGGAKEAPVGDLVLHGGVEVSPSSSSEKVQLFNGNRNFVALDLEKRGCAAALPSSFLADLNSSRAGCVRSSSPSSKSSDLVKTRIAREEDEDAPARLRSDGQGALLTRSDGHGATLTRSGSYGVKDSAFVDGDVTCTVSYQPLDETGLPSLDGRASLQITGSPLPSHLVERDPFSREVSHADPDQISLAEGLPPNGEAGLGGEPRRQGACGKLDAPSQIVAGPGSQPVLPASRCPNREAGRVIIARPSSVGGRGISTRGGRFKRRMGEDPRGRQRLLGGFVRSGLGPDLDRDDKSARGGRGGRLAYEGGRSDRRRGRGQQVWVGSSSRGCTDDDGAIDPERARGCSSSCSALQGEPGPESLDRPCAVAAKEVSAGVIAEGETGQRLGAPAIPKPLSWSAVVCGVKEQRRPDRNLRFVPPLLVNGRRSALCSSAALTGNLQRWQSSLVGRVLGRKPYFLHLKKVLERSWRMEAGFELFSRAEGIFIAKFPSEEACIRILESGPWFFEGKLILLRRWERGGASEKALLHKAPLWIRLPLLPLELWNKDDLSRIVSVIGTPLHVDLATATKSRIGFARCCVEVGFADDLPNEIPVSFDKNGEFSFLQEVAYEWKPPRCDLCRVLGHVEGACPSPPTASEKRPPSPSARQQARRAHNVVQSRGSLPPLAVLHGVTPAVGVCVGEADTLPINSPAGMQEMSAASIEREDVALAGHVVKVVAIASDQIDGSMSLPGGLLSAKQQDQAGSPYQVRLSLLEETASAPLTSQQVSAVETVSALQDGVQAQPYCVEAARGRLNLSDRGDEPLGPALSSIGSDVAPAPLIPAEVGAPLPLAEGRAPCPDLGGISVSNSGESAGHPSTEELIQESAEGAVGSAPLAIGSAIRSAVSGVQVLEASIPTPSLETSGVQVVLPLQGPPLLTTESMHSTLSSPPCGDGDSVAPISVPIRQAPSTDFPDDQNSLYHHQDAQDGAVGCGTAQTPPPYQEIPEANRVATGLASNPSPSSGGKTLASSLGGLKKGFFGSVKKSGGAVPLKDTRPIIGEASLSKGASDPFHVEGGSAARKSVEEELSEDELGDPEEAEVPADLGGFDWSEISNPNFVPPCLRDIPERLVMDNPAYLSQLEKFHKSADSAKKKKRDRLKERTASKAKLSHKLSEVASHCGLGRSTRSSGATLVEVDLSNLPP